MILHTKEKNTETKFNISYVSTDDIFVDDNFISFDYICCDLKNEIEDLIFDFAQSCDIIVPDINKTKFRIHMSLKDVEKLILSVEVFPIKIAEGEIGTLATAEMFELSKSFYETSKEQENVFYMNIILNPKDQIQLLHLLLGCICFNS